MAEKRCFSELAIILPSLNPDVKFKNVVDGLIEAGFEKIVIVNDGSDEEHSLRFAEAAQYPQCTVLDHGVNKGKGRALKTAFEYVMKELPEVKGVVTIDGDGQHLTKDIIVCGEKMLEYGDKVVLGCRNFDLPGVPARSVAGNKTTSRMFRLFFGIKLSDTQTGLRAIPAQYLERFIAISGERFEYETNMLLWMKLLGIEFAEQEIETVYEDDNSGSHYNAVKDSWRIFKVMFAFLVSSFKARTARVFKFLVSSLGATVIDLAMFYLSMRLFGAALGKFAELTSTVCARAVSSFANFSANNALVFENKKNYRRALLRYYCLCIPQMLASAGLVTLINHLLANTQPGLATLIKLIVDTVLFFISYRIQRGWVFTQKD